MDMTYSIHYAAQLIDNATGKVLEEKVIHTVLLKQANDINEFGLRHREQIGLIKSSQDFLLKHQCKLFSDETSCPRCGKKLRKQGNIESDFHDVLTDHKVKITRLTCSCGWSNKYTINSIYGNASHPELVKLQVETGSNHSFDKASSILNAYSYNSRKINNDVTIMRNVTKVGALLDQEKKSYRWGASKGHASEIIITTDGGHVQNQEIGKHSFEELISTVYKPEDIVNVSNDRREITKKISVASAKNDKQSSIKKLTLNACKKSGMSKETKVMALCDGAKSCWSVINSIEPHCSKMIKILDWFHVGKKFKERESKIPESLKEQYNKAKWHLWHGHPLTSIIRLQQVKDKLIDSTATKKVKELIDYIGNNKDYIVNYHSRRINKLVYTSQLAECSVNSVINDRQKNKKMQWTRPGAHNILQIRTSIFSKTWNDDWRKIEKELYQTAG
jgi:hypothetical protein